mmetsp:Transcript_17384/g.54285  ORF Transcript_17384/g.54285 Transcript_17384/m.54285 type:complete len:271 (+) Transcript_17384:257-1069(+)
MTLRAIVAAVCIGAAADAFGTHYEGNTFEDLFGDNGEAGGRAKCQAFSCKEGKQAVPARLSLKVKSGGCDALTSGSMSMFTAKQDSAQTPADACCDRRQACDQICGTSERFCDAELKTCINSACDADDDACNKKKSMLQLMQSMDQGACARHSKAQVAACKCVAPNEADGRRLKVLTEVYKKHGEAGAADKAEGLVKKADTEKKFAALLHKLTAKFPKMLKVVKDPQQEYWQKMMNEAREKPAEKRPPAAEDGDAVDEEDVEDLDATDEL